MMIFYIKMMCVLNAFKHYDDAFSKTQSYLVLTMMNV